MSKNENVKVLKSISHIPFSGPKPWNELTDEERKALKQKYENMKDTKNNKKEG